MVILAIAAMNHIGLPFPLVGPTPQFPLTTPGPGIAPKCSSNLRPTSLVTPDVVSGRLMDAKGVPDVRIDNLTATDKVGRPARCRCHHANIHPPNGTLITRPYPGSGDL